MEPPTQKWFLFQELYTIQTANASTKMKHEIKITEIVPGCWLQHINGRYMQVTKITTSDFACGVPYAWSYNNIFLPIKLNSELLMNLGFCHLEDNPNSDVIYSIGLQGVQLRKISDSEFELTAVLHNEKSKIVKRVKYLHELQVQFYVNHLNKTFDLTNIQ